MTKRALCIASLLVCISSSAQADVDQGVDSTSQARGDKTIVSANVGRRGNLDQIAERFFVAIDVSRQLRNGPLGLHAELVATEHRMLGPFNGRLEQARFGIEARSHGNTVRAFGGVDLGIEFVQASVQFGNLMPVDLDHQSLVFVPRAGVEVGSRIRARATIESTVFGGIAAHNGETRTGRPDLMSLAVSLGVAAAF